MPRGSQPDVSPWLQPEPANWWPVVDDALAEDVGYGDITGGCLEVDRLARWSIEAEGDGFVCGLGVAEHLLAPFGGDPEECNIYLHATDGERVSRGQVLVDGVLPARRAVLTERTALNFLMHLSGVATLTAAFVAKVEGTGARIVDTRKTLPGLRALQKYAVRCGGGHNHRMGLYDGALIKDNHIAALGSVTAAIERVRTYASHMVKIEVECETIDQVKEAIAAKADVIMLDNMDPFQMREAVQTFKGQCIFEASGGISLDTVRGVANTGVDIISVGALTHSAVSIPFHMEFS
jgi:nicotinate-nucleotide pyrophosphorylase (carboxylating)